MSYSARYSWEEPTREEVERMHGPVVLEFGAPWCGYCRAIASQMEAQLKAHPNIEHIKIEDARGKPLGRSFRVKLWPTLVFMRDGKVIRQVARPYEDEIRAGMGTITAAERVG